MYLFARITNSRPNRLGSENKYLNMATWFDFNSIPDNSQRNKEKRQSPKGSNGGDIFIVECKREQKLHVFGDNKSSCKKKRGKVNHLEDLSLPVKCLTICSRLIFTFQLFPILWYALTFKDAY